MLKVVPTVEDDQHHVMRLIDVLENLLEGIAWAKTLTEVNLAAQEARETLRGATLTWEAPALRAVKAK